MDMPPGIITLFSSINGSIINVDGRPYGVENSNRSWSISQPRSDTLRLEVHPGDHWPTDVAAGGEQAVVERSEIDGSATQYPNNTTIHVSYKYLIEPGEMNRARWLLTGDFHQSNSIGGPPPFAVEMAGEHLNIVIRYLLPGQRSPTYRVAYRDPKLIRRGHYYSMNIEINFDTAGRGFLNVWRDGTRIVSYRGPIGYGDGTTYYWKEGIYRAPAPNTIAVSYEGLQITADNPPLSSAASPQSASPAAASVRR
jgi:hypothetical protein